MISPAAVMIAVPCWSSWNTGMFIRSRSVCSMMKHSGALMSSRLIPPKVGSISSTASMKRLTSSVASSMSIESTSAKRLNRTALPSITGLDGKRAEIAEAEDRGAVGNDRDEIALGGEVIGAGGVGGDRLDRDRDPGGVSKAQVALGGHRLGGDDLDLARAAEAVEVERFGLGEFNVAFAHANSCRGCLSGEARRESAPCRDRGPDRPGERGALVGGVLEPQGGFDQFEFHDAAARPSSPSTMSTRA